jgi:NRPS condensation-like uncharacterized protein
MKIIRKFNVNEYNSWLLSRSSPHNVIIAAAVSAHFDKMGFVKALKAVCSDNPILKLSISPNLCSFIQRNKEIQINFDYPCNSWEKVVENELTLFFSAGDALLRINIISINNSHHIIICFHHIICDGKSALEFLSSIINHYNSPSSYINSNNRTDNAELVIERIIPKPIIFPSGNNHIVNTTKICSKTVANGSIKLIVENSKKIKKSVNSILSSLVISAYHDTFNMSNKITIMQPIDLRIKEIPARLSFLHHG